MQGVGIDTPKVFSTPKVSVPYRSTNIHSLLVRREEKRSLLLGRAPELLKIQLPLGLEGGKEKVAFVGNSQRWKGNEMNCEPCSQAGPKVCFVVTVGFVSARE